jgi:aspartyl protease family protein
MKAGSIATLFASALLVGWLAPGLKTADAGSGEQAAPPSLAKPEDVRISVNRSDDWQQGQGLLTRHRDGHFYTEGAIDGARVRFLVDTGASIVALTGSDAESLGLTWDESSIQPIGRGANGVVNGIPTRLDRIEIEGIEARNVEAAIIPEGLDVSLLGQTFLSKVPNVQISGDEMRLGD